jgi:hypothetical protein
VVNQSSTKTALITSNRIFSLFIVTLATIVLAGFLRQQVVMGIGLIGLAVVLALAAIYALQQGRKYADSYSKREYLLALILSLASSTVFVFALTELKILEHLARDSVATLLGAIIVVLYIPVPFIYREMNPRHGPVVEKARRRKFGS